MARSKFAGKGNKPAKRNFSKIPNFWSFSRWDVFRLCPYRYALEFIAKVQTPVEENWAFEHGNAVHALSENYINGEIRNVPRDLQAFRDEFIAVRKAGAEAEVDYTVTAKWKPTTGDDFANAWLRGKLDIRVVTDTLTIIDVKTGKARDSHDEQADIYGMLGLVRHPEFEGLDFEYWYTDSGEVKPYSFDRADLKAQKTDWLARVKPMLSGRLFAKTPSDDACKWCKFRSDKILASGEPGDCEGWKKTGT